MKDKDIREIALTGLKEKFSGASGKLYPLEEGRILKVYNPNYPELLVERLIFATELIRNSGILTPEIFERVTCEGKQGIVFQYLSGIPLGHIFLKEEDAEREKIARKMGKILKQFHNITYDGNELTVIEEMFQGILDRIDQELLNPQQRKEMLEFVSGLPGRCVVHGDFHMFNMILQEKEIYLIDLDSVCIGSPFFELAQIYCVYKTDFPEEFRKSVRYYKEDQQKLLDCILEEYFETTDRTILAEYDEILTRAGDFNRFVADMLTVKTENVREMRKRVTEEYPYIQKIMKELTKDAKKMIV